jgi:hypothetical protein
MLRPILNEIKSGKIQGRAQNIQIMATFSEWTGPLKCINFLYFFSIYINYKKNFDIKTSVFDEQSLPSSKNDEIAKANVPFIKEEPIEIPVSSKINFIYCQ